MPDIVSARPVSGQPVASAWGDEVHDQLEGIQTGKAGLAGVTSSVFPTAAIVFPRAYAVPPVVLLTTQYAAVSVGFSVLPTTAGFTLVGARNDGNASALSVEVHWVAIGKPA